MPVSSNKKTARAFIAPFWMRIPEVEDHAPRAQQERCVGGNERVAAPMTRRRLREACRMRSASVGEVLASLVDDGLVVETDHGYTIVPGVSR